jgi:hypothetical protein
MANIKHTLSNQLFNSVTGLPPVVRCYGNGLHKESNKELTNFRLTGLSVPLPGDL